MGTLLYRDMSHLGAQIPNHIQDIIEGKFRLVPATMEELNLINLVDKESSDGEVFEVETARIDDYYKNISLARSWVANLFQRELQTINRSFNSGLQTDAEKADLPAILVKFTGELLADDFCGICLDKYAAPDMQDADPCSIKHPNCSCRGQVYCRECITIALQHAPYCPFCRGQLKGLLPETRAKRDSALLTKTTRAEILARKKLLALMNEKSVIADHRLLLVSEHLKLLSIQLKKARCPELSENLNPSDRSMFRNSSPAESNGSSHGTSAEGSVKTVHAISQSFLDKMTYLASSARAVSQAWSAKRTNQAEMELRYVLQLCTSALEDIKTTSANSNIIKMLENVREQSTKAMFNLVSYPNATDIPLKSLGLECTPDATKAILAALEELIPANPTGKAWICNFSHQVRVLKLLDQQSSMPKFVETRHEAVYTAKFSLLVIIRRVSTWLDGSYPLVSNEIKQQLERLLENTLRTLAITNWDEFRLLQWPGPDEHAEEISNRNLFASYKKRHLTCRIHEMISFGRPGGEYYVTMSTDQIEEAAAMNANFPKRLKSLSGR